MKTYIGTKIIQAEPATGPSGDGYNVVYKDGYRSWSPKEAFEEAYIAIDTIPNKLSLEDLNSKIKAVDYIRIANSTTTICVITLENGFTVTGKSACIDPANFDAEIGEQIAHAQAVEKMWELEGYLLAQRRFEAGVTA